MLAWNSYEAEGELKTPAQINLSNGVSDIAMIVTTIQGMNCSTEDFSETWDAITAWFEGGGDMASPSSATPFFRRVGESKN